MNERPVPALTPAMMHLAAHLLDLAGRRFCNDGCTDLDLTKVPGFDTYEAHVALDKAANDWNGSPGDHDPVTVSEITDNWVMMNLCAATLRKAAGSDDLPTTEGEVVVVPGMVTGDEARRAFVEEHARWPGSMTPREREPAVWAAAFGAAFVAAYLDAASAADGQGDERTEAALADIHVARCRRIADAAVLALEVSR